MCKMIYLASDTKLPLIPINNVDFDSDQVMEFDSELDMVTGIYIEELSESEQVVRKHFTKRFVYNAYTYQGCGCRFGFYFEDEITEAAKEVLIICKKCTELLFQYIRENVAAGEVLEIYCCGAGAEHLDRDTDRDREIELSSFEIGDDFDFEERQLTRVFRAVSK
ncbi:MAG TPA: hypothetical protein VN426_02160 [Syntrophomonadaceae bacterium]|nr:hypothetical protein [Syntrophomonadaceae bacterium]